MRRAWRSMTTCSRGDVILVVFPHSDLRTYKKRPALVVQSDTVQTGVPQRIVAMITSNVARSGPARVSIRKESRSGRAMGLLQDSIVVTDNLATVLERQVDKVIGRCTDMNPVDDALRQILAL